MRFARYSKNVILLLVEEATTIIIIMNEVRKVDRDRVMEQSTAVDNIILAN